MLPPAPPLFSTMKLPPVSSDNFCDNERATMSVEAPGAKATNKVTGLFLGQSDCADTDKLKQPNPSVAINTRHARAFNKCRIVVSFVVQWIHQHQLANENRVSAFKLV
jgi:hypothetical protein